MDNFPDAVFAGNVYDQTDKEIFETRLKEKKKRQYQKAVASYKKKIDEETSYTMSCCQNKRGYMNWWEEGHDCIYYPSICMWVKGKMNLREINEPETDTWHYMNPNRRLAHDMGCGYDECQWNPLLESPLDHIKRSYQYLGVIYLIDWEISPSNMNNADEEMVWASFRPCGDIGINFSEIIEDYPLLRRPIVKDNQKVKSILQKYLQCLDENMDKIPEGLYLQLMNMNKEIYEAVK